MRVRFFSLLIALLTIPALAFAESHKADFFGGGSTGNGGSIINGFIAGVNWGTCLPWLDVVGPVASTQGGGHDSKALSQTVYHGGVRWTPMAMQRDKAADGKEPSVKHYVDSSTKPFVQFLVGGVITNINDGTGKAIKDSSYTFGVGLDKFWHHQTVKGGEHYSGIGLRVQVDYVVRPGDHTNFTRVSFGPVFRILKEHQ